MLRVGAYASVLALGLGTSWQSGVFFVRHGEAHGLACGGRFFRAHGCAGGPRRSQEVPGFGCKSQGEPKTPARCSAGRSFRAGPPPSPQWRRWYLHVVSSELTGGPARYPVGRPFRAAPPFPPVAPMAAAPSVLRAPWRVGWHSGWLPEGSVAGFFLRRHSASEVVFGADFFVLLGVRGGPRRSRGAPGVGFGQESWGNQAEDLQTATPPRPHRPTPPAHPELSRNGLRIGLRG